MKFALTIGSLSTGAVGEFVKGTFHQHAATEYKTCLRAANTIDACGLGCMHEQDDGGTDADVLLKAIVNSNRGYAFVGVTGSEIGATSPSQDHGIVTLAVTENQMGAMCTKGDKHCRKGPCNPEPPSSSGPWTSININNLHREYIEGVPGYFVQHPTTDPQRENILAHMLGADALTKAEGAGDYSMQDDSYLRGIEVYNSWVDQAWDIVIPYDDSETDPLYPVYHSTNCTAWSENDYVGSCEWESPGKYWDTTMRTLKRPLYGLADDDGFVYTGDSDDTVYAHKKKDTVQTDTASWFRFGQGWSMVDVPTGFTASDVSAAVDAGSFYASTGISLSYNTTGDIVTVTADEAVSWGVTGGVGEEDASSPLAPLNITLCADGEGIVTNVNCTSSSSAVPSSTELHVDLREISGSFFFIRIQALVRTRYGITKVPTGSKTWHFELDTVPNPADVLEGRMIRATGPSRRPFVVQSSSGTEVDVVAKFGTGYGEITPDQTTVEGLVAGVDQLVSERWAWMQPIFRKVSGGRLVDLASQEILV